jgi:hypothetical protein
LAFWVTTAVELLVATDVSAERFIEKHIMGNNYRASGGEMVRVVFERM